MTRYNADLALAPADRPKGQQRMSVEEYRKAVGAPPKREAKPRSALPELTDQDKVAMLAKAWAAVEKLTIELPTPPGLNNAYLNAGGGHARIKSPKANAFYAEATAALATLGQRFEADTYRAQILVTRDHPRADIDGRAKLILDVLVKCGIIPDDRFCDKLEIEWRYKHAPGATIMLSRYRKRRAA